MRGGVTVHRWQRVCGRWRIRCCNQTKLLASMECFDPIASEWRTLPSMSSPRGPVLVVLRCGGLRRLATCASELAEAELRPDRARENELRPGRVRSSLDSELRFGACLT
jgi:hypothetical protein